MSSPGLTTLASVGGSNGYGPAQVGYEKLRPAFDRDDRIRLRPYAEGASVYIEKFSQDNVWSGIPPVQRRVKTFQHNARCAGLGDSAIETLLAACSPPPPPPAQGHTGIFDSLGDQRIRYIHSQAGRRERGLVQEHQRTLPRPPSPAVMSSKQLRVAVNRCVRQKKREGVV
jgi:hypothetical protein